MIYYLSINILGFILMWKDKHSAMKHKYRISERTLLLCIFAGASIGSYLGMWTFHHKTKKLYFHICVLISFVLHIIILKTI